MQHMQKKDTTVLELKFFYLNHIDIQFLDL